MVPSGRNSRYKGTEAGPSGLSVKDDQEPQDTGRAFQPGLHTTAWGLPKNTDALVHTQGFWGNQPEAFGLGEMNVKRRWLPWANEGCWRLGPVEVAASLFQALLPPHRIVNGSRLAPPSQPTCGPQEALTSSAWVSRRLRRLAARGLRGIQLQGTTLCSWPQYTV